MNAPVRKSAVIAVATLAFATASQAALFDAPVAANAYITFNGLDWAWASPVAADGSFGAGAVDLSFQAAYGWRLPTAAEMLGAPLATQFIFAGANVPFGGTDPVSGSHFPDGSPALDALDGDAACAAAYFNTAFHHCDWDNAPGSAGDQIVPWWGQVGATDFSESLVVRSVPESSTYALLALGLVGLGVMAQRRFG